MMEILSTGEKIKRARIYNGITLKQVCEDKISVSKMSCIENNKIKSEDWVLEFISKKLELPMEYLLKDVREQIEENIGNLEKRIFSSGLEADLKYNLEYAVEYNEYDLAFKILHILFQWYLKEEQFMKIEEMIANYYDICQKSNGTFDYIIYHQDMAKYFYLNKEYMQAGSYYENIINLLEKNNIKDWDTKGDAVYHSAICYNIVGRYDKVTENYNELFKLKDLVKDQLLKANIYLMLSIIEMRTGKELQAFEMEKIASNLYGNGEDKIQGRIYFFNALIQLGKTEVALSYMEETIEICTKEFEHLLGSVLIFLVKNLINENLLDKAQEKCDEALDCAISSDNIKLIEKAYFYKAKILQKKGKFSESEMYINLSLDALMKFGTKTEIQQRYLDMGNMYYTLGEVKDSLKYFNLSLNLEKQI